MNKIRVSFGIKYENNFSSGKHKFANRLVNILKRDYTDSIEIVWKDQPCDINITFDGNTRTDCRNIYRVDGIWINSDENYESRNKKIINGLNNSSHIIYQSEFCKSAVETVFSIKRKNNSIIYNGADRKEFATKKKYNPSKPSFISTCKWRPHKRLKYILEGFLNSKCRNDAFLHIYGNVDKSEEIIDKNIIYRGWVKSSNIEIGYDRLLPWCVASVYLAYLDWCPNALVESLCAGVPAIYSNSGGLPFIAKENGIPIKDREWDYKPFKLYADYPLDIQEIANAYDTCFNVETRPERFERPDLFIETIAKQYVDCIKKVAEVP